MQIAATAWPIPAPPLKKSSRVASAAGKTTFARRSVRRSSTTNGETTIRRNSVHSSLRMNEVGLIKASPNEIIEKGTDWTVLDELKREMKT